MQVQAKTKEHPTAVSVEYTIPETCAELIKAFGEDVVGSAAKGAIVISLQAFMRRLIEKGKDQATIQGEVKAWRPDARTIIKQSAFERASGAIDKLTPEERKALIAKLSGGEPAKTLHKATG